MARIEWQSVSVQNGGASVLVGPTQAVELSLSGRRRLAVLTSGHDHEVRELAPYVVEARRWMGETSVDVHRMHQAPEQGEAGRSQSGPLTVSFGASGCPQAKVMENGRARNFSHVTTVEIGRDSIVVECEAELSENGTPLPTGVMVDEGTLAELERLRQEKPALEARVAQLEAQLRDARAAASREQSDIVAERDRLVAQLEGARSDNEALRRTLHSQAETRAAGVASRREGLDRALAEKLAAVERAEQELADLSSQVSAAQARVEELERDAAGRRAQLEALHDVTDLTDEDVARLQEELDGLAARMGFDQGSVELMSKDPYLSGGTVAEALEGAREQLDLAEERMAALMRIREAYLLRVQTSITTTGGDGTIPLADELGRSADGVQPEA